MTNNKLVSVIIPVFNVEPYLREALDSVVDQTYRDLEIIIVDDGSTDGSDAVCDEYAARDSRIKVIHQGNGGLSAARNTGLDHAFGDMITFLDSDDAFHEEAIEKMLKAFENPQVDIACCKASDHKTLGRMTPTASVRQEPARRMTLGAEGRRNPVFRIISRNEAFHHIIEGRISLVAWGKMYRKSIWDGLRFPEGYVYEDKYIIFDVFERTDRVAFTDKELVMRRMRPGSIGNTYSLKNFKDWKYATRYYVECVERNTPTVFSYEQLRGVKQAWVRGRVDQYLRFISMNPDDTEARETLLEMLNTTGRKVGLQNFDLIHKVIYHGTLGFPDFACHMYRLYRRIKNMKADLQIKNGEAVRSRC